MVEIEQVAKLMADRFWDDQGVQAQMRNVVQARRLFECQCLGQLRAYRELGLLSLFEGGPSFSVSYRSDELDAAKLARLAQENSGEFIEACTQEDLLAMQAAVAPVAAISDPSWYEKYFSSPVYDLQIIAIDSSLKGTGAFRKIIEPLLDQSAAAGIPLVLQTHNPENVPLYEHFGLRVLEAPYSDALDLTCYCMAGA